MAGRRYIALSYSYTAQTKSLHGPLTRYAKLRVTHAPGMPGTFSPPPRISDPDRNASRHVRHARAVMHGGIANLRFPLKSMAGKAFPAFPAHVSGKRPMEIVGVQTMFWLRREGHSPCHSCSLRSFHWGADLIVDSASLTSTYLLEQKGSQASPCKDFFVYITIMKPRLLDKGNGGHGSDIILWEGEVIITDPANVDDVYDTYHATITEYEFVTCCLDSFSVCDMVEKHRTHESIVSICTKITFTHEFHFYNIYPYIFAKLFAMTAWRYEIHFYRIIKQSVM